MALTDQQMQLASNLPRITAVMSWLGSLSIIIDVVQKYRNNGTSNSKPTTYHGLMLGISFCDLACSGGHMMTTWPIPADTPGAYAAHGTEASCKTQAFFIQVGIGASFYNLCLSVYYYLFIVKNIRPSITFERCMHFVCISVSLGTAVASLALDLFGSAAFWCWITSEHDLYRWCFWYGPIWTIIVLVSAIMLMIYRDLKKQEKRQRKWTNRINRLIHATLELEPPTTRSRWSTRIRRLIDLRQEPPTMSPAQAAIHDDNEEGTSSNERSTINTDRNYESTSTPRNQSPNASDSVKWQSFRYVGSFFLSWVFLTIVRAMQTAGKAGLIPFWVILAAVTLVPVQGFLNYMIYINPRYKQYRKKHPAVGRFVTFFRINPLFNGCKCCHGASILKFMHTRGTTRREEETSNNVVNSATRSIEIQQNQHSSTSSYVTALDHISQEKHCSEQNNQEAGEILHDSESQV
mmetsp:Transcript_8493/g.18471  ORF Transcript_8493/g.18471 Transcript_8493/m.18471 type:complete len:463 (+) Transcript_8493:246-1634(+)